MRLGIERPFFLAGGFVCKIYVKFGLVCERCRVYYSIGEELRIIGES